MKYILAIVMILYSNVSLAELDLKTYLEFREEPFAISYVVGMARGLAWATTINADKGGNRLYCPPSAYSQDQEMILATLDSAIEKGKALKLYAPDTPVEAIFLNAMEEKFPCR